MRDEAHLPTQPDQEKEKAWFSKPDEYQSGAGDLEPAPSQRAYASHGLGGLEAGLRVGSSARFRRADRLVSPRDYARMRRSGRRIGSTNFLISVARRKPGGAGSPKCDGLADSSESRLGLSVSRRVGNAVVRNRVKRAVREWFRVFRAHMNEDLDVVVIAHRGAADRGVAEIAEELSSLLKGNNSAAKREVRR